MSDDDLGNKEVQGATDGVGPLFHRTYEIEFDAPGSSAPGIMTRLQADIDQPSTPILATFEKTSGEPRRMSAGDEYLIHITGPWNGPVRVADVTSTSFKLVTLEGHLEAGEITFSVREGERADRYLFRIESVARSRDRLVDLVYDKIPVARAAQTSMWVEYCRAVARMNQPNDPSDAGAEVPVTVRTERRDEKSGAWERLD